ncbi:MAG: type II toxin-antitoxin system HicB family antitoxin [Acidobacteria bacterium]|nr:type II toxin-antitoxin system HicB family antitoxin [Acidobacteriota bacterium]MCG2814572.1 type II toxin-antitoxin system HicB family antitoxin [Candidatus Aminicenantes bacterium]MBU1337676.1 type II toxin-antitoxin system HicB family antitoxin [Acidobacteriota bacterium]MBU1473426.1 type II toxin-antitoxin system HicB family antitoxin [Acidobacteriota bacterium]MBU2439308.1 type II toxin-antitoxin system HicB family antitoxin [Acidobacteriota bacterium]
MVKFPILIEKAEGNYSAYSPDLPGCVATGPTIDDTIENMKTAVRFHLEGLKENGLPLPEFSTQIKLIEVAV